MLDHVIERIEKGCLNDKALACQRNAKIQTEEASPKGINHYTRAGSKYSKLCNTVRPLTRCV